MDLVRIEDRLVVLSEPVGVPVYDFDFALHFSCRHPHRFDGEETCILRIGAIADYTAEWEKTRRWGLRLINRSEDHALASELALWYPRISTLTPRTLVFDTLPDVREIEANFTWPIFLKGSRQTSRHNAALAVVEGPEQYRSVARRYRADPVLHWQRPAIREFIPLAPVAGEVPGKIRPSLEYRSFWWFGVCVGWGRYWYQVPAYDCPDVAAGLAIAAQAAAALCVPFLVVDFAKTRDGRWIVIECNDAQESGYAAIPPHSLWRNVMDHII